MLHGTNVDSITIRQGTRWEVSGVPRWRNYFIIKGNESNFRSIYLNRRITLEMQDLRERTQISHAIFIYVKHIHFTGIEIIDFTSIGNIYFTSAK